MNEIKLIIWDLDETFWKGTLSEEGIEPIPENIDLITELTSRGIINSICSKNDFEEAREALEKLEVWDFFVFPSISWQPKGLQVKEIIENCQLRADNVLFLDDNHLNLEEVKYYNEGIQAKYPDYIHEIIDTRVLAGKDDRAHSRLKQYKLLESKFEEKKKYSSNEDFLKESRIKVRFISDLEAEKERVLELINRTNQLNFTKKRLSASELEMLIADRRITSFAVQVQDRFGDYGVVGFVSYDSDEEKLLHFLFSCRIINLGVEQYIYQTLNSPSVDIVGEVVSDLDNYRSVDWISEDFDSGEKIAKKGSAIPDKISKPKLLFIGSCDLDSSFHYLAGYSERISKHMVGFGDYKLLEFPDHILTLLNKWDLKDTEQLREICSLPFFSTSRALSDKVFKQKYDVLVYGVLANYGQNVYRHKKYGTLIAWGLYDHVLTDLQPGNKMLQHLKEHGVPEPEKFMREFHENYEHLGLLSPELFIESLKKFRSRIPPHVPIIFINGSEINPDESNEPMAQDRHILMNSALERYLEHADNCYIIDVRKHARNINDMGKTIRHFQRDVYKGIADDIINLLKVEFKSEIENSLLLRYHYYVWNFLNNIKKAMIKKAAASRYLNNAVTRGLFRAVQSR